MNKIDRAEIVKVQKTITAFRRELVAMSTRMTRIERLLEHYVNHEETQQPRRTERPQGELHG